MTYVALFFAGAFLCNAIPHLAAGLRGEIFPTPFARPRGNGPSSPLVNFLWGACNALAGLLLLSRHPVTISLGPDFAAVAIGAIVIGLYLSTHFAKARQRGFAAQSVGE